MFDPHVAEPGCRYRGRGVAVEAATIEDISPRTAYESLQRSDRARVGLDLQKDLKLPVDTTASIMTSGLLGDRYISLQLGAEQETLKAGDEIAFTESAVILERLIGKLVYSSDRGKTE